MNSEDRALKNILTGQPNEKRVMVGYEGKKQKSGDIKSKLTDIMASVRMPWFCPKCDRIMKKRLDNKMWRLFNHCFECQVDFEHDLRTSGKYDDWDHKRVIKNKIAMMKNHIEELKQWKDLKMTVVEPVNVDTGFVHKEEYETPKELIDEANNAIIEISAKLKEFESYLETEFGN